MLRALHHIQLAIPEGGEAEARAFYTGLLGLPEVAKPATLATRGGVWFETETIRLHLGVERPFAPTRTAHPAFETADLDTLAARLAAAGAPVIPDTDLPGYRRVFTADPFGNRIELLSPLPG